MILIYSVAFFWTSHKSEPIFNLHSSWAIDIFPSEMPKVLLICEMVFHGWSLGCHTLCDILENSCEGNCHEITYKIISFCNAIEVDTNWCGLTVFWSKLVIFSLHKLFNNGKQRSKLINGLLKNRCLAGSDKGFWLAWIPRFLLISCHAFEFLWSVP